MRTKLEILQDSLDVWQSYYDQIEMTDEDKTQLDKLDAEFSDILKAEKGVTLQDQELPELACSLAKIVLEGPDSLHETKIRIARLILKQLRVEPYFKAVKGGELCQQ